MDIKKSVGSFSLRNLSMRELEALLIVLKNDGIERSVLKTAIDSKFEENRKNPRKENEHQSRTKGYDYINSLCKK
ncbi:unnamed protein product, partial [marine sediment metagenome]